MSNNEDLSRMYKPYHKGNQDLVRDQLRELLQQTAPAPSPYEEIVAGENATRGHQSEMNVYNFFTQSPIHELLKDIVHVPKNSRLDHDGIDIELAIDSRKQIGRTFTRTTGYDKFSLQVKSSRRNIHDFIKKRTKRQVHRDDWLAKGRIILDGSLTEQELAADFGFQAMLLSGKLLDQSSIRDFVSLFDPSIEDAMTNPTLLEYILPDRHLLLKRFYPELPKRKEVAVGNVVDLFSQINWV